MLTGEYSHAIDAKGRLIIPSKFRDELGDKFAVTKGLDGCLLLYPEDGWESFVMKLQSLPTARKDAREIKRFYLGGALETEFDKQGRILIPANLLKFAGINNEAVVVGVGNHAEIWSSEKWEDASSFDNIEDIAEKVGDLGLDF